MLHSSPHVDSQEARATNSDLHVPHKQDSIASYTCLSKAPVSSGGFVVEKIILEESRFDVENNDFGS